MKLYAKIAHLNGTNEDGEQKIKYYVFGDAEGLKAFKKAQGEYYWELPDDRKCLDGTDAPKGTPVWNTVGEKGDIVKLIITSKGQVWADNTKLKRMLSLSQQHAGTNIGNAIDAEIAKQLLGNLSGGEDLEQGED